ncbi:MAG: PIG-L family deacetylase [Thermoanaerobaculaceae bacterium]|jgi:LmbE family N-acetylglucosaminyl deacetylase|nr:PIG-L family deacetylase [Thermoanaerobaculaceae bacterium]
MVTGPLSVTAADRVLVVLPHPDDESLAAAGLLQHVVAAGAALRLVFVTDGDNNPWAQRATERRVLVLARDRRRFGALRRTEVLAALATLGVPTDAASFLELPDQGLTTLLMAADTRLSVALRQTLDEFRPTILVGPSRHDRHPDHSALAVALELSPYTLRGLPLRHLRFFIHNPARRSEPEQGVTIALDREQLARKLAAIACHRSQQFWRGGWLRSFAGAQERFLAGESRSGEDLHPVAGARLGTGSTEIHLASVTHWRSFGPRTLLLAGQTPAGEPIRLSISLWPRLGAIPVRDPRTRELVGRARLAGSSRHGVLHLDPGLLPAGALLLAKVEHRFGFFDEAGWKKIGDR